MPYRYYGITYSLLRSHIFRVRFIACINIAVIIISSNIIRKMGDANGEKISAPRSAAHA